MNDTPRLWYFQRVSLIAIVLLWSEWGTVTHAGPFVYGHAQVVFPHGEMIQVELADTPEKRELGLGERNRLAADQGMLFLFNHRDRHRFWMKGMRFPIDIIWLDNYRIVHIEHNVPPPPSGKRPTILEPPSLSNIVLEIGAGQARQYELTIGQSLQFQFKSTTPP